MSTTYPLRPKAPMVAPAPQAIYIQESPATATQLQKTPSLRLLPPPRCTPGFSPKPPLTVPSVALNGAVSSLASSPTASGATSPVPSAVRRATVNWHDLREQGRLNKLKTKQSDTSRSMSPTMSGVMTANSPGAPAARSRALSRDLAQELREEVRMQRTQFHQLSVKLDTLSRAFEQELTSRRASEDAHGHSWATLEATVEGFVGGTMEELSLLKQGILASQSAPAHILPRLNEDEEDFSEGAAELPQWHRNLIDQMSALDAALHRERLQREEAEQREINARLELETHLAKKIQDDHQDRLMALNEVQQQLRSMSASNVSELPRLRELLETETSVREAAMLRIDGQLREQREMVERLLSSIDLRSLAQGCRRSLSSDAEEMTIARQRNGLFTNEGAPDLCLLQRPLLEIREPRRGGEVGSPVDDSEKETAPDELAGPVPITERFSP